AGLLEDAAMQHGHRSAAAPAAVALPGRTFEASRLAVGIRAGNVVLDLLEAGADRVAQALEPDAGALLARFDVTGKTCRYVGTFHRSVPFSDKGLVISVVIPSL